MTNSYATSPAAQLAHQFGKTKRQLLTKSPNSRIKTDPSQRHFGAGGFAPHQAISKPAF